ncbi:MAG: NADH-quinone oxidoreductase subunit M [Pseudomonadota bacterium]
MENLLSGNQLGYPLLSILIFLPLVGAFTMMFVRGDGAARVWALGITLANAALSLPLYFNFDAASYKYQFVEDYHWIPSMDISYTLGVDGISLLLVLLSTFIMPFCVLGSWTYIQKRVKEFMFAMLIMEAAMVGVFSALDFVLFYIFWEAMLIPMYLLIAVWGGPNRTYASIKFFLYTLAGSVMLLVAIIALYYKTGTFSIPIIAQHSFPFGFQFWVFLAFALAFAIKVPMFPFHTWLPAAHVEAPTAGSVILASVLLKMGAYGFLRFCLPITPEASHHFMPLLIGLSIASIIYGGYVALGQSDMKKLIAYSSVGHMGFVTLGTFVFNSHGIEGALLQMINHGITTGALFLCVGVVYERSHSRLIADNAGVGKIMPLFVLFFGIFSLSSLAFPGTNSFVGEILVLIGAFTENKPVGFLAIPGAIMAAAYMLRLLQKIVWGERGKAKMTDLNFREVAMFIPLTVFVFWIGFGPAPFLKVMHSSVSHLVEQIKSADTVAVGSMTLNELWRLIFTV